MSDVESRLREIIYELHETIYELRRSNELLRNQAIQLRTERDISESRIRHELEPRIKRDNRAYDQWATSLEQGVGK
jgi:hypothetical protein